MNSNNHTDIVTQTMIIRKTNLELRRPQMANVLICIFFTNVLVRQQVILDKMHKTDDSLPGLKRNVCVVYGFQTNPKPKRVVVHQHLNKMTSGP